MRAAGKYPRVSYPRVAVVIPSRSRASGFRRAKARTRDALAHDGVGLTVARLEGVS